MKLIDAPIGIFRFDGELVLKTEYKSENRQNGKYIPDCYIVRTGEYFWGGAKTANELNNLDVEPVDFAELLPTVTDTISRKAVTDAIEKCHKQCCREDATGDEWIHYETTLNEIESIPSALTTEVATDINVGDKDTISRQAAIDIAKELTITVDGYEMYNQAVMNYCAEITQLPPAQPERIKGHWIRDRSWSEGAGMGESYGHYWKCDKCGHLEQGDWGECGCNFCSNCGSDNREVTT